jgi:hypothetical protein
MEKLWYRNKHARANGRAKALPLSREAIKVSEAQIIHVMTSCTFKKV